MRIHTNTWELWERPIRDALKAEQTGQAARTKRGYLIGRRGANRARSEGYPSHWGGKHMPRTITEIRQFAHLPAEVTS